MSRTPTLVNVRGGKRMVGNISVDEMITRILMGHSAAEIARDTEVPPASISRVFRSETGVNLLKYKGLGRLIHDRLKTSEENTLLLQLVEKVKNGELPRKIISDVGASF